MQPYPYGDCPCNPTHRGIDPTPVLQAMQALWVAPGTWCQGAAARDLADQPVHPCAPQAVAWDVVGAWQRATADLVPPSKRRRPRQGAPLYPWRQGAPEGAGAMVRTSWQCLRAASDGPLGVWNDRPERTHASMRAWLAAVLAQARTVWPVSATTGRG